MTRYTRSRGYNPMPRSHRLRPILLILLVLLAAFLIFKSVGVGGIDQTNFEVVRSKELTEEVGFALSSVNSLSRLGASSSSAMLGRVRQYVHGVEVINELNIGVYGDVGRLYPQSMFDSIYSIIEQYEARLSSGQKVNDTLTELNEAVTELSTYTYTMLGRLSEPVQ